MTLRPATPTDRDAIVAMAQHFMRFSHYGRILSAISLPGVTLLVEGVLKSAALPNANTFALVAEDDGGVFGMLGLIACPHPLSGDAYGEELCWWVEPTHRGARLVGPKMLARAEAWARERGLKFLKMVAPTNVPIVGRFYERAGYVAVETAYVKGLA